MNRPHYYYTFPVDSVTGRRLEDFLSRCDDAEEKARAWAERQGAFTYYESPSGMAGGCEAVEFEDTLEKEGWERVVALDGCVMFLPETGGSLEKEMYALPVVSEVELVDILSLKPKKNAKGESLPFTFGDATPVVFCHHGVWYADVPYESGAGDGTPIMEKEFYRRRMAATNEA